MRSILFILLVSSFSMAQDIGEINDKTSAVIKYGYQEELYKKGDAVIEEEWLTFKSSDASVSVDTKDRSKMRAQLNTTLGKLLGMPKFKAIQLEGKIDTHKTDYFLVGTEMHLAPQLNMFLAAVMNDGGVSRAVFGPYVYLGGNNYIGLLFYPKVGDMSSYTLRNHFEIGPIALDANAVVKSKTGETYRYGGLGRIALGPIGVKYEYIPYYEGSAYDRHMYGVDVSWVF